MTNSDVIALSGAHILPTYARFPLAIERVAGATAYDFDGREYLDLTSGIGVNSIGGSHPKWLSAVTEQAAKLAHVSNLYHTEPAAKLAKTLTERTGMRGAFFCNSGAEANEGLIKLARKYSFDKYGPGRSVIITLKNSFHGRTVTTLSATGQDKFHNYFHPFTEGFRYVAADNMHEISDALENGDVAAIMVEPVQGEGGVLPLDRGYLLALAELCAGRDILLLLDEVQTGIGRTGSLFAFQDCGVTPDAVSFAKGIASGLPFGGFLVSQRTANVFGPGDHATTFGANPVCAAAANAVLEVIDDALLQDVRLKGEYIISRFSALPADCVTAVRGRGLMIGIELPAAISARDTVTKLIDKGVLALTAGANTLRLLPPLTISSAELERGIDIIERTLTERG